MMAARQMGLPVQGSAFAWTELMRSESSAAPALTTDLGALFHGDCLSVLPLIKDGVIDTVFADPPFNLGKVYGKNSSDDREESDYVEWCKRWLDECIRVLRPGGALFVYNLPKWNILLGAHLMARGLDFRHWVAVDIPTSFPIAGRLYPSHYSLLYFTKGPAKTFKRIRVPVEICRHCSKEIKDYGGHRGALRETGLTLKDVWTDIPPVRHRKFKPNSRGANALSTKLLDRVIEMSTTTGDVVLDPFGGSGTTYDVCEKKHRQWIGIEIDNPDVIVGRLTDERVAHHRNDDFVEDD